jgi:hypothetical protein
MSSDGAAAEKYRGLISKFINHQMPADDFQAYYLALFKRDTDHFLEAEFRILDRLFADADDYIADPEYRAYLRSKDPESLKLFRAFDEEELRDRAREAYRMLYGT